MAKVYGAVKGVAAIAWQGMLEVDTDTNAERIAVFNRVTMARLYNMKVAANGVIQLRVPLAHTENNTLLVGIVDDDGVYNCKFVDGVKAQLVDGNVLSMKR